MKWRGLPLGSTYDCCELAKCYFLLEILFLIWTEVTIQSLA